MLSLFAVVAFGQLRPSQDRVGSLPEFDVASIKVFKLGSAPEDRHISAAHGVLTARQQTLGECIEWAYGLKESGELKGPRLLEGDQYDILAKTKDGTGEEQVRLMLRRLLAERFKLSLHRKTEERPVYSLVVGKNGLSPRMKLVDREPAPGFHMTIRDGVMNYEVVWRMDRLAVILPTFLDLPVVDKTGLTGVYEFQLKVEMNPQTRMPQQGEVFQGFGFTPGIFSAVDELGLKLVKEKGTVEILVVDHVERPLGN